MLEKFEPMDIAATIMIVGCIAGLIIRPDAIFKEVLLSLIGFYFGRKIKKD